MLIGNLMMQYFDNGYGSDDTKTDLFTRRL